MRKPSFLYVFVFSLIGFTLAACKPPVATSVPTSAVEEPTVVQTVDVVPPTKTIKSTATESSPEETVSIPTKSESLSGVVQAFSDELEGLSLVDFFDTSNRLLTLRSPEMVVTLGLTDFYGVEEVRLDDISEAYQRETFQLLEVVLNKLDSYDRESLSPSEKISYDVYRWFLEDRLAEADFFYHDYPATYYPITAVHEDTLQFFTDIHPIRHVQDARDYVTRLGMVDEKIEQLIDNLEARAEAGIIPPQFAVDWAVYGSLGQFVRTPAKNTSLYLSLQQKMLPLSSGTPAEMQALLDEAEIVIEREILPAYQALYDTLTSLETYPGGDCGVWRLPQGQEYYANRLHHFTTTNLTAEEIHQLGIDELERIHNEMRQVFDQLSYPEDIPIVDAYDRVAVEGGYVAGDDVLQTYRDLIRDADQKLGTAFDIHPEREVIVVPDPYGDFYIHPAMDGSRPGAFYAGVGAAGKEAYAMPTLAYHETIPGHHFQIALAQEMVDLPSFRRGMGFTAYAEGWALYAERLAWELGWYESDPYGYLGFLQSQAFRAARLVVDTGLHAMGWTFDQAQAFFTANTGFEVDDNVNPEHEIARYLVWPGQSTAYYVGYLKFVELRQRVMDELGDQFDIKDFHHLVLTNGSMPLQILEALVSNWLDTEMAH